jgi:thiosulfate/3-mercaptopyruvate sulfurtransferase
MPIINATQFLNALSGRDAVIIDARGGPDARERYARSHVRGALFVDLETELSSKKANAAAGGRHPLPDVKQFGSLLSKLGITPASHVMVYDDKNGANAAARFWWMMKSAGHERIDVVSGGLENMQKSGVPFESGESVSPDPSKYVLSHWRMGTVTIDEVEQAAKDPERLVIDVRENYRYRGESEPIDLTAGHIPGAVNVPYTTNLSSSGEFLTTDELISKYKEVVGSMAPEQITVHCGSGVTACHTLLAMDAAGIKGAKLYVGSWSEWSRNNKEIGVGEGKLM